MFTLDFVWKKKNNNNKRKKGKIDFFVKKICDTHRDLISGLRVNEHTITHVSIVTINIINFTRPDYIVEMERISASYASWDLLETIQAFFHV